MLGKEVAERVGLVRPGIRVLYMSGYAQPIFGADRTLEAGVVMVEKPFTGSVLLAKLARSSTDLRAPSGTLVSR